MCGRFTIATRREKIEKLISGLKIAEWREPQYDVRPTQDIAAVLSRGPREVTWLRWGLVPPWADDLKIGSRFINARGETLAAKPTFRGLLAGKRCAVIADGFFEWQPVPDSRRKLQMHFHLPGGEPFLLAGLWESWSPPDGPPVRTCTLITTAARGVVAPVHDRMPVMLDARATEGWLRDGPLDPAELAACLSARLNDQLAVKPWAQPSRSEPNLPGFG